MKRALAVLVAVLAWLVVPRLALAQSIEINARVSRPTVEVGEVFGYTVQASTNGDAPPDDVQPGNLGGFAVLGHTSGPQRQVMFSNGVTTVSTGIVATWQLRATKTGTFTLGPASVKAQGGRRTAGTVRVTVVPQGQAPKASPFDPFRGLFDLDDDRPAPPAPAPIPPDPKLALSAPRASIAFLHAVVDKTKAVVGEQVTLSIYLYEDPYERQAQPRDVHEPTAPDFVKKALVEDESRALSLGTAMVGDRQWQVKLLRKSALFPLKSGRLEIGPMSMTLPQARVGLRETEHLTVDVVEPPLTGRPPGYAVGDVGDMSLSATVSPRAVDQDGAVGVTVELRGTGNLPSALTMPVAPGIEWLDAQTSEKLGAQATDRFGGTRTFSYVARMHKDGAVDLGEVRLPFYDPDKGTYGVARASLGIIDVKKGVAKDAGAGGDDPILPNLPKERRALEGSKPETFLADRPLYWALLYGSPAACALAIGLGGALRRLRDKRAAANASPKKLARDRRAEAEAACAGDDGAKAMGAIARAVEAAVLAQTGVNVRGGATSTIARELEDAGVADPKPIVDVLRACEDARFSPDGVDVDAARAAWKRAKDAIALLALVLLLLVPTRARADEDDPAALFQAATAALAAERPNEAIAKLEAMSDRGVVDAVVSYDRGLAYAARVRAGAERPGDLGRAAHGFEEARELSRDPALVDDASRALAAIRGEIARRRARAGDPVELEHGITLGRTIVKLLPENTWAILAALAAAALTAGMVLVVRAPHRRARVAGMTTCAIAGALVVATSIIVHSARDARFHLREGVIVAGSRLLDARHIAKDGIAPVPEGARARILGEDAGMVHVEVGAAEGWLPGTAILPLAKR